MAGSGAPEHVRHRLGAGFVALAAVTYALLVFGSTVRVHGAGLACPDWPLCFGELLPRFDFRILLEWGHRVLAGGVSLGFTGLSAYIASHRELRHELGAHLLVLAGILCAQIVFGGLTVLKLLAYWSVTTHLLLGNAFMVGLVGLAIRLRGTGGGAPPRGPVAALAVLVTVQMALGGLVSSNYAGLACTEWPTCNGGAWFPTFTGIVGLQLAHRLGAYAVLVAAGIVAWRARGLGTWVLALVLGQVAVGISNVLLAMPAELAVLHAALAHGIVALTSILAWRAVAK
ncbi:MAG: COX15/CtaA family protein [Deltaproteobacteria bacterium]|nr:COX15/CtaA family protein [Deltaproteobacteria bacterium]